MKAQTRCRTSLLNCWPCAWPATPLKEPAGCLQIPTIGFLYIAGWIGYVGRQYLNIVKGEKKPTEKEIIIDVPLALRLSLQGAGWPLKAIRELQQGTLTERAENITVCPADERIWLSLCVCCWLMLSMRMLRLLSDRGVAPRAATFAHFSHKYIVHGELVRALATHTIMSLFLKASSARGQLHCAELYFSRIFLFV